MLPLSGNLSNNTRVRAAKTSPSGGSTAEGGDRGAFSTGASPVCMLYFRAKGAVFRFYYHGVFII